MLQAFVDLALKESDTPAAGSDCVLARLSELMFVDVVRRHLAALSPGGTGWLAGLRDDAVGRCLGKLHEQPARAWTLEDLARENEPARQAFKPMRPRRCAGKAPWGWRRVPRSVIYAT